MVASQRGPEKPLKIAIGTKIPHTFILTAYRSSRYPAVGLRFRINRHGKKFFLFGPFIRKYRSLGRSGNFPILAQICEFGRNIGADFHISHSPKYPSSSPATSLVGGLSVLVCF